MEATQHQLYDWAIDILTGRAMPTEGVRDPDALRKTKHDAKHTQYRDKARWYFQHQTITSPEQLADLLEPPPTTPDTAPNPTSAIPLVTPDAWQPLDPDELDRAHARIKGLRDQLN